MGMLKMCGLKHLIYLPSAVRINTLMWRDQSLNCLISSHYDGHKLTQKTRNDKYDI